MDLVKLEHQEIKKHVGAIHVSGKLNLMQRKVSNVLLMNAYEELLEKETHRIPVHDLMELVGFDSNNREFLKESVKSLMTLVLEWNILDTKGREKDWEAMPMLSYARVHGGYISYRYPKELKEKLYNPEVYARIDISMQRKFSSGYALTLHENLVRFRKVGSSGWIDLEDLKRILGVENAVYYREFRRLNSKIIRPAVKEINDTSNLRVEPEYRRENRRVTAVRFLITDNPQLSLFRENPLYERLLDFGLSQPQARDMLTEHDEDYIAANLDVVERYLEAGKIRTNLAAATLDALKRDYRPKTAPLEAKTQAEKVTRKQQDVAAKEAANRREELAIEFAAHQLQQAITNLSDADRQALQAEFIQALEDRALPGSAMIIEQYRKAGLDSITVQAMFRSYAREKLVPKERDEAAFQTFLAARQQPTAQAA